MDPQIARDAGLIFFGSRDFLLAWELLEHRHQDHDVLVARAPWPMRAWATCSAFALELALKARLRLEEKQPRKVHSYSKLYRALRHRRRRRWRRTSRSKEGWSPATANKCSQYSSTCSRMITFSIVW